MTSAFEPDFRPAVASGVLRAPADLRARLIAHPLYGALDTLARVRTFMEHHVFAVWDFMALLKSLQRGLTCVDSPWQPIGDPGVRRFINEIVVGEESDIDGRGGHLSHFELYLEAMNDAGADRSAITAVLARITAGASPDAALAVPGVPAAARAFSLATFEMIASGDLAQLAGAFAFGREDLIPDMFRRVVGELSRSHGGKLDRLIFYLDRHIEVDASEHGPSAFRMLEAIARQAPSAAARIETGARRALSARLEFWDGIVAESRGLKGRAERTV